MSSANFFFTAGQLLLKSLKLRKIQEDLLRENNMASSQAAMLANVLHRVRLMEESQSRSMAMLNKLRLEMDDVAGRLHKLDFSHKSAFREINSLLERFGEQMAISRGKEQEKARLAFLHLRGEMEEERNACSLLKMQNKKLTENLTHANVAAADTCKELGRERKARELLEEVCNELAREIGEDKAEVEKLKQEQEESRERLEEELKMLRMAALWREESARSRLSGAKLELVDDGKQGMPVQELEAFASTVGGTCEGSQEEIEKKTKQAECLAQAREKASFKDENQLDGDEGKLLHGDGDTMNGLEHPKSVNETRRPHNVRRRRRRTSGQQRYNVGSRPLMRIYDQKNSDIWETHCESLAWSSSEDEPDKRQLMTLQNCMPYRKGGHVLEGEATDHNVHVNANSAVANKNDMRLASSGYGRHSIVQEMRPSVFATSSLHIKKKEPCHLEQSLCNAIVKGSHRKQCSSARFEVGAGGEVDHKLATEMGPSIRYSFSEDDAASYIGSQGERRRKQGPLDSLSMSVTGREEQTSHNAIRDDHRHGHHRHNNVDIHKSTGTVDAGAEGSELEDFYFEPVRAPTIASTNNINCKANGDENAGDDTRRVERGLSNRSDEAQCGIMAKHNQGCKESKDRVHESAESITILDDQELSNIQGSANSEGQETMNKMSPWRSASAKLRPHFWRPSPDAFSIIGEAKKCCKARSSTPARVADDEQHMKCSGGMHSHAHRQASPAKEATHQQHLVCMKNDSLGAHLIKAREPENEKRAKAAFRFSPLRRAISRG